MPVETIESTGMIAQSDAMLATDRQQWKFTQVDIPIDTHFTENVSVRFHRKLSNYRKIRAFPIHSVHN